jgi:4-oxalocrotonate tautomerase family enzyme
MPLINATFFEGRLDAQTEPRLIEALTEALVSVFGPEIREQTWVVLHEVPRRRWGVAGHPSSLPDTG